MHILADILTEDIPRKKAKVKDRKGQDVNGLPTEVAEVVDINSTRKHNACKPAEKSKGDVEKVQISSEIEHEIVKAADDVKAAGTSGTEVKTKRKRVRKHKKKKKTDSASNLSQLDNTTDVNNGALNNVYVGKEVKENDRFYGCLPDRLEPPKYYRHGYRNKKTYDARPNCHKKFDSDSEVEEGTMEHFNFLSKSRESQRRLDDSEKLESSGFDGTLSSIDESYLQNEHLENTNSSTMETELSKNSENPCTYDENTVSFTNSWMTDPPASHMQVTNTSNTTSPGTPASPTLLTRKTLSNGTSVFCRQRSEKNRSSWPEMSKEDQLNTVATHVSTIFVVMQFCLF